MSVINTLIYDDAFGHKIYRQETVFSSGLPAVSTGGSPTAKAASAMERFTAASQPPLMETNYTLWRWGKVYGTYDTLDAALAAMRESRREYEVGNDRYERGR